MFCIQDVKAGGNAAAACSLMTAASTCENMRSILDARLHKTPCKCIVLTHPQTPDDHNALCNLNDCMQCRRAGIQLYLSVTLHNQACARPQQHDEPVRSKCHMLALLDLLTSTTSVQMSPTPASTPAQVTMSATSTKPAA